jgi:hypothetical protein
MTQVVVTERNNTVIVDTKTPTTIVTGIMGPPGKASLGELQDLDLTELENGSLLVYSTQAERWRSTTTLENQLLNGGAF